MSISEKLCDWFWSDYKNSIIGNSVVIQDGNKIGKKDLALFQWKKIKFPHIGRVLIEDDVEIASSCTIDRGSVDILLLEKILI